MFFFVPCRLAAQEKNCSGSFWVVGEIFRHFSEIWNQSFNCENRTLHELCGFQETANWRVPHYIQSVVSWNLWKALHVGHQGDMALTWSASINPAVRGRVWNLLPSHVAVNWRIDSFWRSADRHVILCSNQGSIFRFIGGFIFARASFTWTVYSHDDIRRLFWKGSLFL